MECRGNDGILYCGNNSLDNKMGIFRKKIKTDFNGGARMHYSLDEFRYRHRWEYTGPETGWTRWMIERWNRPGTIEEQLEVMCWLIVRQ